MLPKRNFICINIAWFSGGGAHRRKVMTRGTKVNGSNLYHHLQDVGDPNT